MRSTKVRLLLVTLLLFSSMLLLSSGVTGPVSAGPGDATEPSPGTPPPQGNPTLFVGNGAHLSVELVLTVATVILF